MTERSPGCERVESRGEERLDRRGDVEVGERAGRSPRAVSTLERALVDEHAEQLLREERVALGCDRRRGRARPASSVPPAEQALDHRSGSPLPSSGSRSIRVARGPVLQSGLVVAERRARRTEDEDWCGVDRLDELARRARAASAPPSGCPRRRAPPGAVGGDMLRRSRRVAQASSSIAKVSARRPIMTASRSVTSSPAVLRQGAELSRAPLRRRRR